MPKISVIIPIYNAVLYIEKCAHSLFKQTLADIEYIFIDDCSTDNSIGILNEIMKEYPNRIKQVNLLRNAKNSGQAHTRKIGSEAATGDFIIHCDSDDWVDITMYEKLYNYAILNDLDLVWCSYYRSDGTIHNEIRQYCEPDKNEVIKAFLSFKLIASVCNRLYKRSLLSNDKFVYPSDNMTEDFVISTQVTLLSSKIGYWDEPLYYYYSNPNSICLNVNEDHVIKNYQGLLNNTELVLNILAGYMNLNNLNDEVEYKKCFCKEILIPILDKKKYRKLWLKTYPEINKKILRNKFIPLKTKIRAFCLIYHLYPVYALLKK